MKLKGACAALSVAGFVIVSLLLEASTGSAPATVGTIDRDELRSTLHFLASDALGGRDTGSAGNRVAANYLAHRFELMGLEPAGDDGSFFQAVGLARAGLEGPNSLEILRSDTLPADPAILLENYYPSPLSASGSIEGTVLFAGYGITAPQYDYDDYSGVNASGRVVVVLEGEPSGSSHGDRFLGEITTEFGRPLHKILNAQQHGAAALLLVSSRPGTRLSRTARSTWPEEIDAARYQLALWLERIEIPVAYVGPELAQQIGGDLSLTDAKQQIDDSLQPSSRELDEVRIALTTGITHQLSSVPNVLARLRGSDPSVADESVVVSAHFDHVGTRGEEIFNGADDDGSGTVAVLEVAEAFALSDVRPRRDVIFALWNAEERGLLGSRQYVAKTSMAAQATTAVYQLDMVGRNEEVPEGDSRRFRGLTPQTAGQNANSLHIIGYSFSEDLRRLVVDRNNATGLELKFELDRHPISLLTRSDHWPFLVAGIPSIFFTSGLHPDYHRPTDTADRINYAKLESVARLTLLCAWESANTATPAAFSGSDFQ